MSTHLPVIRSPQASALFLATAVVSVAILIGIQQLRQIPSFQGLSPIFFVLFTSFDYRAAVGMLGILLGAVFLPDLPGLRAMVSWIGGHPYILALATTVGLCLGAVLVYGSHPLAMDEYAAYFQSQVFAAGRLTGQFPAPLLDWLIPIGFQNVFLSVSPDTGQVISSYWPSFALLLTPFTWLGIPWACNPVLSGLTVIAIRKVAMKLFGDVSLCGLVVLLTIASPVFFADGISYYAMTAHMLANTVYVLLLLQPSPRRSLLAGIVGSVALTLHNPLPHLLFAAPWGIWLATRPQGLRSVSWLVAGYLPLSLVLGVGWFWFSSQLMHGSASAIAYAPGGMDRVSVAFALPSPTVLLARLIGLAKVWLWAVPGLLLLAGMGTWKWRRDARIRLFAASALATLIGYLFVPYDQGHGWGFRYFHSAWLVLPLLAGAAFAPAPEMPQTGPATRSSDARAFVVALALLSLVFCVALRGIQIHEFVTVHLGQLPQYAGSEPRIQFIDTGCSFGGVDLIQNDPFLRDNDQRMLSRRPEANAALIRTFHADFHQVFADSRGEVWSAAPE